jgi:type II secretory pathway component GspD/PulD (secretin)
LTPAQTTALLNRARGTKDGLLAAPKLMTFNGQRAYAKVVTQCAYVRDMKVLRDAQGKFKSYEPDVQVAESGTTVDVQATMSADRKFVTLSVRPKLSTLLKINTMPFRPLPADHPAGLERPTIQVPEILASEVRMTVSVPDGQTLVLGGFENSRGIPTDGAAEHPPKPGQRLYILVTPKIIMPTTTRPAAP